MEEKKQDLLKLRIAKKAYVFDVRRRYSASRNFALKKKAETPAEDFGERLKSVLSGKRPAAQGPRQEQSQKPQAPAPAKPASRKNAAIIAVAVTLLLFIVAGAVFVMWRLGEAGGGEEAGPTSVGFGGSFNFSIRQSELLSVQEAGGISRAAYFLVDYRSENLSSLNFTARLFSERPSTQVFLLDYAREGADSYPVFRRAFLQGLSEQGVQANEIGVEKLASLPGGATVVVPTGYFPTGLLGAANPSEYKKLLARGNNIVYVGFPLDRALGPNGVTVPVSVPELSFSKAKPSSSEGFRLFDAQYVAGSGSVGSMVSAGQIYGSASVVKYGQGAMIFLPQSLDGGWRGGGEAAADDLVRLIVEERWLAPLAQAAAAADAGPGRHALSMLSTPFASDSAYVEFFAQAADDAGAARRSSTVFRAEKLQKGEMSPREAHAVPYYVSGQPTRLNIVLAENDSRPVKLFVRLYRNGTLAQEEELELGLTSPTTEKPKDIELSVEPGTYVARVEDREGKEYAATALDVLGLDVWINGTDWQRRRFSFVLSAAGEPAVPRFLLISMDGRSERRYSPSSYYYVDGNTFVGYDYPEEIKPGSHIFYFTVGNVTSSLEAEYRPPRYPWDDPLVLVLALLSVLVFAAGVMLRRPEVLRYGLDVPDFPPISATKIPVGRKAVLQIFNDVNAGYSWQWMPLRVDEVKNGFRRLTHNGRPILIGDFNLERLLARLKDEGLVKEELGYWGLTGWESQSGHSIGYLTVYRIMRNVFVNNAVRFSKLDAMADCDVKAVAGKEEIYFHIMADREPEKTVHRALATAKKGTTIMVFRAEEERDSFRGTLTSTSKLAVALKMEINTGNILLLPVKNAISAYLRGLVK